MGGIRQFYVALEKEERKIDTLCDLLETLEFTQAIIYCNTRRKVDAIADQLSKRDFTISIIHTELGHREPHLAIRDFQTRSSRVLISTDLPAMDVRQKLRCSLV